MKKTKTTKALFFDYQSTALIRFKECNVFTNDRGLWRIKTEKLDFTIAQKLCIQSKGYVYIPNQLYREILNNFYKTVLQ